MSKGFRQMQVAYLIWHFRHEKEININIKVFLIQTRIAAIMRLL